MSHEKDDSQWLKRGKQRAAVARVLRKPMLEARRICLDLYEHEKQRRQMPLMGNAS